MSKENLIKVLETRIQYYEAMIAKTNKNFFTTAPEYYEGRLHEATTILSLLKQN